MYEDTFLGHYAGFVTRLTAFIVDFAIVSLINIIVTWFTSSILLFFDIDWTNCPALPMTGAELPDLIRGYVCTITLVSAPFIATLFVLGYIIFFWTTTGQTPGKAVMGVRVLKMDESHMDFMTAVRRLLGYGLSFMAIGLGFAWILIDNRRQGWHDKLSRTYVVYSWRARYDERFVE